MLHNNHNIEHHRRGVIRTLTSKTPRQRSSLPNTPASSTTSLIAVTLGSSSGSTPPPGTIQWSGRRDEVTRSIYNSIIVMYTLLLQVQNKINFLLFSKLFVVCI